MLLARVFSVCVCFLYILIANAAIASNVGAQSTFRFLSAEGDYIGQGQKVVLSAPKATFKQQPVPPNYIEIDVFTGNASVPGGLNLQWSTVFGSATGAPLTVGSYPNARGAPGSNNINPLLMIYGEGHGCDQFFGNFDVLEIEFDETSGELTKFAANFSQSCESPTAPLLIGSLRINSSVPLPELINPIITLTTQPNLRGCVEATSPSGGIASFTASSAGGAHLVYNWTASTGATGSGSTFSTQIPLGQSTIAVTATDTKTNVLATKSTLVCSSDTTRPTVVIVSPIQGATYSTIPALNAIVTDAVDKDIAAVSVSVGENGTYTLPKNGHLTTGLSPGRTVGDNVPVNIAVSATDASGNVGFGEIQIFLKK